MAEIGMKGLDVAGIARYEYKMAVNGYKIA